MSDKTSIEWTQGDDGAAGATWNPVRGCSRVSPGCGGPNHEGGCYAEKIAARFSGPGQPFEGFAERTKHGGRWTGKMALVDDMLTVPLRWRKPRRIFVNSMSDLFHDDLPDEAIDKVFAVMALAPQHTFQVLTKRSARIRDYVGGMGTAPGRVWFQAMQMTKGELPRSSAASARISAWPLPNVWLGVSVEDQERADERIPDLLATPAAVRFLSCEPLLGPVDLNRVSAIAQGLRVRPLPAVVDLHGQGPHLGPHIDWVIAGGESGPRARPSDIAWFRALRDQCATAGVWFFQKQITQGGKKLPIEEWPEDLKVREFPSGGL